MNGFANALLLHPRQIWLQILFNHWSSEDLFCNGAGNEHLWDTLCSCLFLNLNFRIVQISFVCFYFFICCYLFFISFYLYLFYQFFYLVFISCFWLTSFLSVIICFYLFVSVCICFYLFLSVCICFFCSSCFICFYLLYLFLSVYQFYLFLLFQLFYLFLSALSVFVCFYLFLSVFICFYLFLSVLSLWTVWRRSFAIRNHLNKNHSGVTSPTPNDFYCLWKGAKWRSCVWVGSLKSPVFLSLLLDQFGKGE